MTTQQLPKLAVALILGLVFVGILGIFHSPHAFANTLWPDSNGNGIPNWVESTLTGACTSASGPHTYHMLWVGDSLLTPTSSATTTSTTLRGASYVCPGVNYSYVNSLTYNSIYLVPNTGLTLSGTGMNYGNVLRGQFTPMKSVNLSINLSNYVPANDTNQYCFGSTAHFTVDDYPGGVHDSASGYASPVQFCIKRQAPPIDWALTSSSTVSAARVAPGGSVTFRHDVYNSGPNTATNICIRINTAYPPGAGTIALPSCNIGVRSSYVKSDTITIPATATNGQLYCQSITYNYADGPGQLSRTSTRACTQVVAATIDGVKIDDSNGGGYGGNCAAVGVSALGCAGSLSNYPFSDDTVTISGEPAMANNYFSDTGVIGGAHTISIASTGSADGLWQVVGYSICNSSFATDCTAANMGFGDKYFVASASTTIPSLNLVAGDHYHIRWVFKNAVPGSPTGTLNCSPTSPTSIAITGTYTNAVTGAQITRGGSLLYNNGAANGSPSFSDGGLSAGTSYTYSMAYGGALPATATCTTPTPSGITLTGNATPGVDNDENPTSFNSSSNFGVTPASPLPSFMCSISVTKNGGAPLAITAAAPCSPGTVVGPNGSISGANAGDKFCAALTVTPGTGTVVNLDGSVASAAAPSIFSGCQTIVNKPYFKVFNSSVTTGGDVNGPPSTTRGALAGWYNNQAGNDYGASAQLGAFALVNITGFASNQTGTGRPPSGLSFANTGLPPGAVGSDIDSPKLGGLLNGNASITPLAQAPAGAPIGPSLSPNINSLISSGGGPYTYGTTGSPVQVKINNPGPQPINAGETLSMFVVGDVFIDDNIVYNQTGWSLGKLPSFVLSVTGNIFINGDVTQLDGTYEATGNIYTCAVNSPPSFVPVATGSLYGNCNKQLTVTGSFVAKKINLLRTFGSLRDEAGGPSVTCSNPGSTLSAAYHNTCAAEVFEFSPEQYLQKPAAKTSGGTVKYDAITSLPPVL